MKLYSVTQERTERVQSEVKVWAESEESAIEKAHKEVNSPGGYMFDRTLETVETKTAVASEITDPQTLKIWASDEEDDG